jgi:hypothetical protein
MTDSLVHAAFDPQPYVVFSACSVAMGILLEVGWNSDKLRRVTGYLRRNMTPHALHAGDASRLHSLGIAEH